MNILIAAFGKIAAQDPHQQIIEEYRKRLPWKLQILELSDKKAVSTQQESALLFESIPKNHLLITLDETGKNLTSAEFAKILSDLQDTSHANIAFAIGGASGHDKSLLAKSNLVIALGKSTMPHKLARVVLVEQIYRAHTIITGHPYHK